MTPPDELVQAVHDANVTFFQPLSPQVVIRHVLAAVPDGWAKIDGEWVVVTPGEHALIVRNRQAMKRGPS